jgi:hypothetical protein
VVDVREPMDDARLGELLGRALSDGVDEPVDTTTLVAGARQGARRIRRRRRAGVAVLTAVAVAGLPAAHQWLGRETRGAQVASVAPSEPTGTGPTAPPDAAAIAPPTGEPSRPPVPPTGSPTNLGVPEGMAGSVVIPDEALLAAGDVPFGVETVDDFGHYLRLRTLTTSLCGDGEEPGDDAAVGGRELGLRAGGGSQVSVVSAVRVFSGDGARRSMDFQAASMGGCSYAGDFEVADATGLPGDQAVLGIDDRAPYPDTHYAVGAVRLGATTVGVAAVLEGTPEEVLAAQRALLEEAVRKLEASGLPAAHPGS